MLGGFLGLGLQHDLPLEPDGVLVLHDHREEPAELVELYDRAEVALYEATKTRPGPPAAPDVDARLRAAMRANGYIGGSDED